MLLRIRCLDCSGMFEAATLCPNTFANSGGKPTVLVRLHIISVDTDLESGTFRGDDDGVVALLSVDIWTLTSTYTSFSVLLSRGLGAGAFLGTALGSTGSRDLLGFGVLTSLDIRFGGFLNV